jgi:hypothetical protein
VLGSVLWCGAVCGVDYRLPLRMLLLLELSHVCVLVCGRVGVVHA